MVRRPNRGKAVQVYETTPILDGKLITETAETAYKARREPHVPLMLGSNSADTAGNRIRATSKEQFFARFGQWSAQAKAAYDPDGSKDLATLVAEGKQRLRPGRSRLVSQRAPSRQTVRPSISTGSPTFRQRCGNVSRRDTARRRNRLRLRHLGHCDVRAATTAADTPGSGGLSDGAELLGQLRQDRRSEWCGLAGLAALRSQQGFDLRFPSRWLGQRGS